MQENVLNVKNIVHDVKDFVINHSDYIIISVIIFLLILLFKERIFLLFKKKEIDDLGGNYSVHNNKNFQQKITKISSLDSNEQFKLSWTFLTDIISYVKNFFSKEDQDIVHRAGSVLKKHNVKYIHIVQQELYSIAKKQNNVNNVKHKNFEKSVK